MLIPIDSHFFLFIEKDNYITINTDFQKLFEGVEPLLFQFNRKFPGQKLNLSLLNFFKDILLRFRVKISIYIKHAMYSI